MKEGRDSYRPFKYRCANGHSLKLYQWLSKLPDEVSCQQCNGRAFLSIYNEGKMAQGFVPPVAAYNPVTKEYRPLASSKSRVPNGFERVELRTAPEINQFVRSMNEKDYREHQQKVEREQRGRESSIDPLRDYRPQTEQGAMLLEYAKQEAERSYEKRFQPSNYFDCFEMNPSNMD